MLPKSQIGKIAENSNDIICTVDEEGRFVWINQAVREIAGFEPFELTGRSIIDCVFEDDQIKTAEITKKIVDGERVKNFVTRFYHKNGKVISIEWSATLDDDEHLVYCIARDITEKKELEELVEKTRQRAQIEFKNLYAERNRILESISDAFFAVDRDWTVTYWNREAETVLGTKSSDIVGKNLWDVYKDAVNLDFYHQYHKAMKTGKTVNFEEYYPAVKKWFEVTAYPSEIGLSVYFKDVTGRKESEESMLRLNKDLKRQAKELSISNAELEQFAYVASHDLQEPLRMVTSFLTQLQKNYQDQLDERANKYIHYAVDGSKRMRQIILDLLEFSRVGKSLNDLEKIDLNRLIDEIGSLYKEKIDEKGAKIIKKELPVIYSHRTALFQIFQNLISNSLKYAKESEPPVIDIVAEEHEEVYQFTIGDNGIGIDEEYFDKVFIIFQRLHGRGEYSGSGMGLAIVKKWIESLGGQIWLRSKNGEGTKFTFTIAKRDHK